MRPYNSFVRIGSGIIQFTASETRAATTRNDVHVTIVGGVHGNERIGVDVLDALKYSLLQLIPPIGSRKSHPLIQDGATITLVYANEKALRIGKRGSTPHADLNRCFSLENLQSVTPPQSYEEQRARELAPLFARTNVLIDVHSTNKPSDPFIRIAGVSGANLPLRTAQLASQLPCDKLLLDPHYLICDGSIALTDEYVSACGGIGICYESGIATDISQAKVEQITTGLWNILEQDIHAVRFDSDQMSLSKTSPSIPLIKDRWHGGVFEITEVFKLKETGFRWASDVGNHNFQHIPPKQHIGYSRSDDQEKEIPFSVEYDSYIVFPKVPALWKVGGPLGWLSKKVVL